MQLEKPVFSEDEVAAILRSILSGLAKVHALDLVHRDIKPENIVLGGKGIPDAPAGDMSKSEVLREIRIIDFGFSAKSKLATWNELDSNVGTLLYMAPEQLNTRTYGKKVDIYACGITMFYLLAGHHPIYRLRDSTKKIKQRIASEGPANWEYPSFVSE